MYGANNPVSHKLCEINLTMSKNFQNKTCIFSIRVICLIIKVIPPPGIRGDSLLLPFIDNVVFSRKYFPIDSPELYFRSLLPLMPFNLLTMIVH